MDDTGLQIDSPEHELRRLLKLAGFPNPMVVEPVAGTSWAGRTSMACLPPSEGEGRGKASDEWGRLRFSHRIPEPVQGPVAWGTEDTLGWGDLWC